MVYRERLAELGPDIRKLSKPNSWLGPMTTQPGRRSLSSFRVASMAVNKAYNQAAKRSKATSGTGIGLATPTP